VTDRDRAPFQPTAETPLVVLSLDDAHLLLEDPQAVNPAEEIAVMGRTVGVVLRVASTGNRITSLGSAELAKRLRSRRPLVLPRRTA
jgi:hypothetical protein